MFRNNKNKRVNLSEVFLASSKQSTPQSSQVQPVKEQWKPANQMQGTGKKISKNLLALLLLVSSTTFALFYFLKPVKNNNTLNTSNPVAASDQSKRTSSLDYASESNSGSQKNEYKTRDIELKEIKNVNKPAITSGNISSPAVKNSEPKLNSGRSGIIKTQYKVNSKAYFYRSANNSARNKVSIKWKKSYQPFNALSEQNGFVYAVLNTDKNKTLEGWLRKKDLMPVKTVFNDGDLK